MDKKAGQAHQAIEQLNQALGDVTPYRLILINPREIKQLDKNAHYMSKKTFDQLVANIQMDGNLSSLPFLWRLPDGRYECLSGNHRLAAAIKANVPLVLALWTDAELSRSERIAIQLSHNAIFGKDNPSILRELWQEIDQLELKIYTGLDEKLIQALEPVPLIKISEQSLKMEEVSFLFVEPEIKRLKELVKKLSSKKHIFLVPNTLFDDFFEILLSYKESQNVVNTATAMTSIISIVEEHIRTNECQT